MGVNESRIKLIDTITRPKSRVFHNEKTGVSNAAILVGESLSVIDDELHRINVSFEKQLQSDDIIAMIKGVVS